MKFTTKQEDGFMTKELFLCSETFDQRASNQLPGVNFTNILQTAFTLKDPKNAKQH